MNATRRGHWRSEPCDILVKLSNDEHWTVKHRFISLYQSVRVTTLVPLKTTQWQTTQRTSYWLFYSLRAAFLSMTSGGKIKVLGNVTKAIILRPENISCFLVWQNNSAFPYGHFINCYEWTADNRRMRLTGVRSSGVEMGELSLFNLIPLPRSKSQILTGEIWKRKKNIITHLCKVSA